MWSKTWKQGESNSPNSSRYSKLNATYSSSVPATITQQNKPDHKKREDEKKTTAVVVENVTTEDQEGNTARRATHTIHTS